MSGRSLDDLAWWQNPWAWAVVIGLAFITLTRPCTRHIPDPPQQLSELPLLVASDQTGGVWDSREFSNRVHVVSFHSADCGPRCEMSWKRMDLLYNKVRRMRSRVRLVTMVIDGAPDIRARIVAHDIEPSLWRIIDISGTDAEDFRASIRDSFTVWSDSAGLPDPIPEDPVAWGGITIVDRSHRVRSFFDPAKGDASHELFHRAERLFSTPPRVDFPRE